MTIASAQPLASESAARWEAAASGGVIVYLAGVAWDAIPGTDRRLVTALSELAPVLWVDPPSSALRLIRRGLAGLRTQSFPVHPNVMRLRAAGTPGVTRPVLRTLTRIWVRRAIRKTLRTHNAAVRATIVAFPETRLGRLPGAKRFYYLTDDFVAGAKLMGRSEREARRSDAANVAAADTVLVVSPALATRLEAATAVVVLPNGCDPEQYATVDDLGRPADVRLNSPMAGVIGQLNERLDLSYLSEVVDRGVALLLVGPRRDRDPQFRADLDALLRRDNVQWVGERPVDELAGYLSVIDVCLTPYADTPFNRASFPLKTLEYLAAGRAVVSTDLPAVEWLNTEHIQVGRSSAEFADQVVRLLNTPTRPEQRIARQAVARSNSWAMRAQQLFELI